VPIIKIYTSDLDEEFYDIIRERYKLNNNSAIICTTLKKDHKAPGKQLGHLHAGASLYPACILTVI
jgi:hypothetical protein